MSPSQEIRISIDKIQPRHTLERSGLLFATERFFTRHRQHLGWVHLFMFIAFLGLILVPPLLPESAENATLFNDYPTFARYLMWGLWFPLVFMSVIATGRSWCGLLCPMGAASEFANKRGLQRAIPRWISWEGTPIVSFILVTILGQTVGVREHPEAIAEIFGGTMLAAIVIGFIWGRNKRAWCRHVCPIGLLLGVFSRLGAIQFTPKRQHQRNTRYTERGLCPTMIELRNKDESRHCIECFRCVNPEGKSGLYLKLRHPGEEVENIRRHNPNPAEVNFFFLGTGVALGGFLWLVLPLYQQLRQLIGEWLIQHEQYWIGDAGPWWLMSVHPERREVFNWLDFSTIIGFILATMLLFYLCMSGLTWLSAWLAGRMQADANLKQRYLELAYQFMPVAMVSLLIGLGGELFKLISYFGLSISAVNALKAALFLCGLLWSLWLGIRILRNQNLSWRHLWLPLLPGVAGCSLIGTAWYLAIFA